jgi:hypothetical protein
MFSFYNSTRYHQYKSLLVFSLLFYECHVSYHGIKAHVVSTLNKFFTAFLGKIQFSQISFVSFMNYFLIAFFFLFFPKKSSSGYDILCSLIHSFSIIFDICEKVIVLLFWFSFWLVILVIQIHVMDPPTSCSILFLISSFFLRF